MCNLYRQSSGPQAIMDMANAMRSTAGNLAPGDVYPDYAAPIVRTGGDGVRELAVARWGMPSSSRAIYEAATKRADKLRAKATEFDFQELLKMEPDGGTTNVRNTASAHWKRWLEPSHRCLVPFTAFSEPGRDVAGKYRPVWFKLAGDDPEPLAFFAGIHLPGWQGVRKIKTKWETADLFAFLTTDPSEPVKSVHPKAMPVILTQPDEIEAWMTASWLEARALQRALPASSLVVLP
ncbi:SOS response-associated peptidase [Brevundimonas sp.]|uniref:SOS response-associated peptidase n=1 Tax=Brevundimonas sp. TaxID=1871086 RepID=UPI0025BDE0FC|nr:SOS response-associated peptidase family protein [Brevundimonas sp.]MCG2665039.1 SOS response-associated peptidase family protein [Brevundimonas sp.]